MRLLKEQGYEVHYASDGEEQILDCDKEFTIPFARSPFNFNNIRAIGKLKKIIDSEDYDIIHTHTPMGGVVTRMAAVAARSRGTRVIYTAHGFHFFKGAPITNWLIYFPIEKIMARFTDTLITINKEDFELAKKRLKTEVRYVRGVGIDADKFNLNMTETDKTKMRRSLGLKSSDFIMIYVAELSKRKNQIWMIRTLSELMHLYPDMHLVLPGKDSLNGAAHKLALKLGLYRQIHFLGYRDDVPLLMRISNLALSASKQEGLPLNVMEAMHLGLPVVATDCRGNRDLLEHSKNAFIVKQRDSVVFIQSTLSVYNNANLRKKIKQIDNPRLVRYGMKSVLEEMKLIYEI